MPQREVFELDNGRFRVQVKVRGDGLLNVFLEVCDKDGFCVVGSMETVTLDESAEFSVAKIVVAVDMAD